MHAEVDDAELPPAEETPAPMLVPGARVTPSVRLSRKLGDGGMGSVWIAEHTGLGCEVVVKFMSPSLAVEAKWVERFRTEAELAARVRHPHVVQVFDHGVTADGLPFIVMELLEGRDLGEDLSVRGRLLPGEVTTIVQQTAKALQRVHDLGFVHRDVKPENIFLCDLGTGEVFVKLLDFGIAKRRRDEASSLTSTGVTMGTPHYMSPELIVSAKNVDRKADLWALAVVAFEALTGVLPFAGETIAAVTLKLHAPARPRVTALVPSLPPALDEWFEKALAHDPAERFPDARTMARALAAIVPPMRQSVAPESSAEETTLHRAALVTVVVPRAPRRSRWLVASGVLALALLAGVAAWTPAPPSSAAVAAPLAPPIEPATFVVDTAPIVEATASAIPRISVAPPPAPKPVVPAPKKPKPTKVSPDFDDVQ